MGDREATLGLSGCILRCIGDISGPSGAVFRTSWPIRGGGGARGGHIGHIGRVLRNPKAFLGRFWGTCGPSWGNIGGRVGVRRAVVMASCAVLARRKADKEQTSKSTIAGCKVAIRDLKVSVAVAKRPLSQLSRISQYARAGILSGRPPHGLLESSHRCSEPASPASVNINISIIVTDLTTVTGDIGILNSQHHVSSYPALRCHEQQVSGSSVGSGSSVATSNAPTFARIYDAPPAPAVLVVQ